MTIDITEQASQNTEPAYSLPRWERFSLADQSQALAVLNRITELHPDLPAAHITFQYINPFAMDVQSRSWAALEAWRVALDVPSSDVEPGNCAPEREHVQFTTVIDGVPVRVWAMGELVKPVAIVETAEAVSA